MVFEVAAAAFKILRFGDVLQGKGYGTRGLSATALGEGSTGSAKDSVFGLLGLGLLDLLLYALLVPSSSRTTGWAPPESPGVTPAVDGALDAPTSGRRCLWWRCSDARPCRNPDISVAQFPVSFPWVWPFRGVWKRCWKKCSRGCLNRYCPDRSSAVTRRRGIDGLLGLRDRERSSALKHSGVKDGAGKSREVSSAACLEVRSRTLCLPALSDFTRSALLVGPDCRLAFLFWPFGLEAALFSLNFLALFLTAETHEQRRKIKP